MLNHTQTGALLHRDHVATLEVLQSLDEFMARHRGPPVMDGNTRALLEHLGRTLKDEVECHFLFEENHLFPVFTAQGETGIVMMLTQEHRTILPLAVHVAALAVRASQIGFDAQGWREFRDAASELVEREIFHVQKEEMGLLAAISSLVDADTDARLSEAYRSTIGKTSP